MKSLKILTYWVSLILLCQPLLTDAKGELEPHAGSGDGGTSQLTIIVGANPVAATETHQYSISGSSGSAAWSATGGTILSQTNTNATIRWDNPGSGTVSYSPIFGIGGSAQRTITIQSMEAPNPVQQGSCGLGYLTYSGNAPSRVSYYWQTQSNGTSTLNQARDFYPASSGTYYLRARNNQGIWGTQKSITYINDNLVAPTLIQPSAITNNQFQVNWSATPCATSYRLYVSANSAFSSHIPGYNGKQITGLSDLVTNLPSGYRTFYYRLKAVSASETSGYSPSGIVYLKPTVPVVQASTSLNTTSFVANWNASQHATSYLLYVDQEATDGSLTPVSGYNGVNVSATSRSVQNLAPDHIYRYRVRALNVLQVSDYSIYATADLTIPETPDVTSSNVTDVSFRLDWPAVSRATGYRLDVATNASFSQATRLSGYNNRLVSGTSIVVSGLQAGQQYFFRVRAENQMGTSGNDTGSEWTTVDLPAPVATAATNVIFNGFTANWNGVAGQQVTYLLDIALDPGFNQFFFNMADEADFQDVPTPDLSMYINAGLGEGLTCYYRVRAKQGPNLSDYSNVIQVNTPLNIPDQDDDLNWLETTIFDNTGPISASKTYFDYTGLPLQSQARIYTEDRVLATATLYDQFMKPSLQTLPAPINGNEFSYHERFISSSNGAIYKASKWEGRDPEPVDDEYTGTVGWYYSENNDLEPLTDVSPYPFRKQVYYQDGTGELKTSLPPGDPFMTDPTKRAYSKTFPVLSELDGLYLSIRNALLGENTQTLSRNLTKTVGRDGNGKEAIFFQDAGGKILVSAYGYIENGVAWPVTISFSPDASMPDFKVIDFHIPGSPSAVSVSANGSEIRDLLTEAVVSGNSYNQGYYRCFDCTNLSYQTNYYNAAFDFYDNLGRLIVSITPKGVESIIAQGLTNLDVFDLPYATYYTHDSEGRVVHRREPDTGSTRYVYRKDGSIRFIQNAKQASQSPPTFSYTNYDRLGRRIESGEYVGSALQFGSTDMFDEDLLEAVGYNGGFLSDEGEDRKDWSRQYYDVPDANPSQSFNEFGFAPGSVSIDSYEPSQPFVRATQRIEMKSPFRVEEGSYFRASFVENEIPEFNLPDQTFVRGVVSYSENENSKTWYSYDDRDRITWMATWYKGVFEGPKLVTYEYDFIGNVTGVAYQEGEDDAFFHRYFYDADQRLSEVHASTTKITQPSNATLQAKYIYYLHGPLKRVELANNLQGTDYVYNLQGALKAINNPDGVDPGGDTNDAFAQLYQYYAGDFNRSGIIGTLNLRESQYSGNIAAVYWSSTTSSGAEERGAYDYLYDDRYYLKDAQFRNQSGNLVNAYRVSGLEYDANGNIRNLLRKDGSGTNKDVFNQQGGVDGYQYQSQTNQLQSVRNYASYTYNEIGEMVTQTDLSGQNMGTMEVSYDVSGKVVDLAQSGTPTYHYDYDDRGFRNRKQDLSSTNPETVYVRDATGQVLTIYEEQGSNYIAREVPIYGIDRLGTFSRPVNSIQYELKDHLGNVRAVLSRDTEEINQQSDYYPFGAKMRGSGSGYRYGYQGEFAEDDTEETGWNQFQLRMYDPSIGRWSRVDPMREFASPYNGMGNNPTNLTDPDGGCTGKCREEAIAAGIDPSLLINEIQISPSLQNWISDIFWAYGEMVAPEAYINFQVKVSKNQGLGKVTIPYGRGYNTSTGWKVIDPESSYLSYKATDYVEYRIYPMKGDRAAGEDGSFRLLVIPHKALRQKGTLLGRPYEAKLQLDLTVKKNNEEGDIQYDTYAGFRGVGEIYLIKRRNHSVSVEVNAGFRAKIPVTVLPKTLLFPGF